MYRIFPLEANFDVRVDLPTVGDTEPKSLYTLDADSIAEVFAVELVGPVTVGGTREKLEYVVPTMDGNPFDGIHINELMAPPNAKEVPVRRIDLGKPLLLGGNPMEAARCPKYPPSQIIGVQVKVPAAVDGGAALTGNFKVRLMVVEATEEDIERVLTDFGTVEGGNYVQDVELRDRSAGESYTIAKRVPFDKTKFCELYGGQSVTKPRVSPLVTYAQNSKPTTPNEEYEFRNTVGNVSKSWMDLYWNLKEREVVAIDKVSILPHTNSKETTFGLSERAKQLTWRTSEAEEFASMPLNFDAAVKQYFGPMTGEEYSGNRFIEIARNTILKITHKDNGTVIPAWSATARGMMVAVWGYKLEDVTVG